MGERLELAAVGAAVRRFDQLGRGSLLTINLSPDTVGSPLLAEFTRRSSARRLRVATGTSALRTVGGMTMATTASSRRIECDGAFNVRDLGGYRARDGRTVRWRRLFRADGLHRVATGSSAALDALGWRTVLDLRTDIEVGAAQYRCDGVEVVHLPILRETWDVDTLTVDDEPAEFLAERYLHMTEVGGDAVRAAFTLLASREQLPAVFHCSAGKDRTGVLAALLLSSLGVDDAQIADDYHLSAPAMAQLVAWITAHRPEVTEHMARQPAAFLSCPPDAILLFLDRLRERHGSVPAYLREVGVGDDVVTSLRGALLER